MSKPKLSFPEWIRRVDAILLASVGLRHDDLPDVCYRDWYDDGVSASTAAARARRNAMEG